MAQNHINHEATLSFLRRVLPGDGVYQATKITGGGAKNIPFESLDALAEAIAQHDQNGENIYHACASFNDGANRKADNTKSMKAFWIDLDCGPEKAEDAKGYMNKNDAIAGLEAFCRQIHLPMPMIVDSGGGFHVYWTLSKSIAASEWKALAAKLKLATEAYGLLADPARTADAASILRPVGSLNRKYHPPRQVHMISDASDIDVALIKVALGHKLPLPTKSGVVAPQTDALANLIGYIEPTIIKEGGRNAAVLQYVGHLRGKGTAESVVLNAALNFNKAKCVPPLDEAEVERVVASYTAQANPDPAEWPNPKTLSKSMQGAPKFDFDMLPRAFVCFVRDASERMGVPPDNLAVPLMLSAAAALGSNWAVCPKANDKGWKETAVLWGGIVAPPGSKKSPCLQLVAKPLHHIEAKLEAAYKSAMTRYQLAKKMAGKDKEALQGLAEPKRERATVQDATYQKLAEICSTSPIGLMAQWDEIASMIGAWRMKGQEAARGFFLTSWSGDQPYTVDRKESGTTHIPRLFMVISGGVQPSVLGALVRDAKQVGAANDGLIQRFQMMVYPDDNSAPVEVDRAVDELSQNRAFSAVEGLRSLTPSSAMVEAESFTGRGILHFSDEAQSIYDMIRKKIEAKAKDPNCDPLLASHYSKMSGAVAKLAMLIHLLDGGKGNVSSESMHKAVKWAGYLRDHAKRIYSLWQMAEEEGAMRILEKIKARILSDGFTAYDITHKGWADLKSDVEVKAALAQLVNDGWLRSQPSGGTKGGRPTEKYTINPATFAG